MSIDFEALIKWALIIYSLLYIGYQIGIVRCRECKRREEYPCKVYHDDDWYCADGERREP